MTTTSPLFPELLIAQRDWTLPEYHAMIEAGILGEDDHVELLFGKIIEMSPTGRFHAVCVSELHRFFAPWLDRYVLRSENPITLPDNSEPEPDFVVAVPSEHRYLDHHPRPRDIELLIEVADNSLETDRKIKSFLYARSGIKEYWIINLPERQIERHTDPQDDGGYRGRSIYRGKEVIDHGLLGDVPVDRIIP